MSKNCVWKVKEEDRNCGYCVIRRWCGVSVRPLASPLVTGKKYIGIAWAVTGEDPLSKSRRPAAVWARNIVAYRMSLDGYTQEAIAPVVGRDRCTVMHCIQRMSDALASPKQYPDEVAYWNMFQERLSLSKTD